MVISKKFLSVYLSLMLFGIIGIGMLNQCNSLQDDTIYLNNVGATKCWKATCGHKSKSYSYKNYKVDKRGTDYHHGGTYLDPDATETFTISKTYMQSMNVSAGVDGEVAKASVGYSGSKSTTLSKTQTLKNTKKYRRYPHLGVEYQKRSNTVTIKKRTYDPAWHLKAKDKYCQFKTTTEKETCKVYTAVGLSLLDRIRYDF